MPHGQAPAKNCASSSGKPREGRWGETRRSVATTLDSGGCHQHYVTHATRLECKATQRHRSRPRPEEENPMHRSQRLALRILGLVCMLGVSGIGALQCTTTNSRNNTATGRGALSSNTTGVANTATGVAALVANTTGSWNTA